MVGFHVLQGVEEVKLVSALVRFSHEYEQADESLAATAWELAAAIADEHGLSVGEAVREIDVGRRL